MSEKFSLVETSQDPIISPSPHLPAEILSLILSRILPSWSVIPWTSEMSREFENGLLSCCLVSKAWCEAASEMLYRSIRLSQLESLRLLLRTVRSESFGGHCPALALHFRPRLPAIPKKHLDEFAILAGEIVFCSPKLLYLTGDRGPLYFTSTMSHPKYLCLTMLKVSGQDLQLLAPLLPHLCNLKSFEMIQSHGDSDILNLSFVPPSFKLTKLSISRTELSPGLCKWLFASTSESLEFLEVEDVGADLRHLIEVIGGSVKELHIKSMVWHIMKSDSEAIKVLSGLAGLRRLRIDGWNLERKHLLDLQSSLETFEISSYVALDVETLLQSGWQPSLQSVDMYVEPVSSLVSLGLLQRDLQRRHKLAQTCAARGIQLNEKLCT